MSSAGAAGGRTLKVWLSLGLLMMTVLAGAVAMGLFSQSSGPSEGAPAPAPTASPKPTSASSPSLTNTPASGAAIALVGRWLSTRERFHELIFAADGTFEARGATQPDVSGTYTVDEGAAVTLSVPVSGSTTYRWSVQGPFLRLTGPDGSIHAYTRAR